MIRAPLVLRLEERELRVYGDAVGVSAPNGATHHRVGVVAR